MANVIVTHDGKEIVVAHLDYVRFRLALTRRGRKSSSVEIWTRTMQIAEVPTFAASQRVEDLIPLRLVETVESDFGGVQNTWTLAFDGAVRCVGELLVEVSYSCASSKSWPLQRCLMGLDWSHETTYPHQKAEAPHA